MRKQQHLSHWLIAVCLVTVTALATTPPATVTRGKQTFVIDDRPLTQTETDFYTAIARNDVATLKTLLEQGIDPNMPSRFRSNGKWVEAAMLWSLKGAHPEAIEVLLKHGGNANFMDVDNNNLLVQVISSGSLYSTTPGHPERANSTPAERERNQQRAQDYERIAHLLLDYGADPNSRYWHSNGDYTTALSFAVQMDDLDLVKRLIDLGANVHEPKNTPRAPLFEAAKNANVEIAKVLLEKGADVFSRSGDEAYSRTFLTHAISTGKLEFSLLPLSYGATLDDYAARMLRGDTGEAVSYSKELLHHLLDRGMSAHNALFFGQIKTKDLESLKRLVELGASLCTRDKGGKTAYEDALTYGTSQDILDYLKAQGGDHCPPANN